MSDLDLALREAGSGLHLHVPLDDVVARGARIRRRRQRLRIAAAGTALAAVAGVATLVLPPSASPIPAAEAGWGRAMLNLSDAQLANADAECRSALQGMEPQVPAGLAPLAADSRGGTTVLIYRFDGLVNTCSLWMGRGSFLSAGQAWDQVPEGHHFAYLIGGGATPPAPRMQGWRDHMEDPITDGIEVLRVGEDVSRLVLHVAGQDIEATVDDGMAVSWLPDGALTRDELLATVTAYDADGDELESGPLHPGLREDLASQDRAGR